MAQKKQVWVSPDNKSNEWRIHTPGAKKDILHTDTRAEALKEARKIAINQKAELKVQKLDGTIGLSNSYGNDPCPPKDKK